MLLNYLSENKHSIIDWRTQRGYILHQSKTVVILQNCCGGLKEVSCCISLALSYPKYPNVAKKNRYSSDGHQGTCEDYSDLYLLIDEVTNAVNGLVNNSVILYDVKIAKENIFKLQQHIIRHVQQNKAKVSAMDLINKCTRLWIKD